MLKSVRERLLILGQDALGIILCSAGVFLHRELDDHRGFAKQLTGDLKIFFVGG